MKPELGQLKVHLNLVKRMLHLDDIINYIRQIQCVRPSWTM